MIRTGNKIVFEDGYCFYETEHGPLVEARCEACGGVTYEAEYRRRQAREERDPQWTLCQGCTRDLWFGS